MLCTARRTPLPPCSKILVHAEIEIEDIPVTFRWLEIDAPDSLAVETVDSGLLGPAWRGQPAATRRPGDQWLASSRSALLRVPSALVPETWNVLINPLHADAARIRVARVHAQTIDRRLL